MFGAACISVVAFSSGIFCFAEETIEWDNVRETCPICTAHSIALEHTYTFYAKNFGDDATRYGSFYS